VLILLEVVLVGSLVTGVRMAVLQIPASQHTGICIVYFTFCFKYFPIVPIKNPQGPGEIKRSGGSPHCGFLPATRIMPAIPMAPRGIKGGSGEPGECEPSVTVM